MASQTNLNVSLTPELEHFITTRIASGRYRSAEEVVHEGLRLLKEREGERETALEEVRQKIAVGLEQAERGELLDGEEVFRKLEKRINKRVLHGSRDIQRILEEDA
jgi:antitoxin ParD1/3/4